MPRQRKLFVQITSLLLWASGIVWLALHYFFRAVGPFGPEANPAEPLILSVHGACAFVALVAFGYVWARHILPAWSRGERRASGGVMVAAAIVLIVTGYLLYYLGDENLRAASSILHWAIGVSALIIFLCHRRWRRKSAPDAK